MATAEILAPEPKAIALVDSKKPAELFVAGAIDGILAELRTEVMALPRDISTDKGRKAIASNAFKLAGLKNRIDERGKAFVEARKKEVREIDKERGRIWDFIEAVQKDFRKPLTEWEEAEKTRVANHEAELVNLAAYGKLPGLHSIADIESYIEQATALYGRNWEDFAGRAAVAFSSVTVALNGFLATAKKVEADRIELERLRAEQVAREAKEREERVAQEAREKAERKAREAEEAAAAKAEGDRLRIEREKTEAEERARRAEAQRIEDARLAEERRISAEQEAERRRVEAEAQAVRDREAAVEAERQRVADEQRKVREAAEARERNREHAAKIHREIVEDLKASIPDITLAQSLGLIKAIVEGRIRHTKINY